MSVDNVVRIFAYDGTLLKEINKGNPMLLKLSDSSFFCRDCPKMMLFYILSERLVFGAFSRDAELVVDSRCFLFS